MFRLAKRLSFRRVLSTALMLLLGVVVVASLFDLAYTVLKEGVFPAGSLYGVGKLPEILSLFLWVLIGVELLDSVRSYVREHHFHVESVVSVAIIAVARKVIVLDIHELDGTKIVGLASVIVALGIGYFLVRRSHAHPDVVGKPGDEEASQSD